MLPKNHRRGYKTNTTAKPDVEADKVNCTRGKASDSASHANESERNSSSTCDGMEVILLILIKKGVRLLIPRRFAPHVPLMMTHEQLPS